jgi:hypothetical protein
MRIGTWIAAAVGLAAVAAPARAQSQASSLFGVSPSSIVQKPIDMSTVVSAAMPAQPNRFSFSSIIRKLSFSSGKPTVGVSPLPPPSSFPTFPSAKLVGTPPTLIGDPKASKSPFQPVQPTTMTLQNQ